MNTTMPQKRSENRGYTLLFAVIVSVLVLSIAAFILSVSRKQAILSSSARDSIYAFYAADSGLECAIEHISTLAIKNPTSFNGCGSPSQIVVTPYPTNTDTAGTSTFFMSTNGNYNGSSQYQSGISSCASTTISYVQTKAAVPPSLDKDGNPIPGTGSAARFQNTVEARGYNIGWNSSKSDCSLTGPRKVERALRYVQG